MQFLSGKKFQVCLNVIFLFVHARKQYHKTKKLLKNWKKMPELLLKPELLLEFWGNIIEVYLCKKKINCNPFALIV